MYKFLLSDFQKTTKQKDSLETVKAAQKYYQSISGEISEALNHNIQILYQKLKLFQFFNPNSFLQHSFEKKDRENYLKELKSFVINTRFSAIDDFIDANKETTENQFIENLFEYFERY